MKVGGAMRKPLYLVLVCVLLVAGCGPSGKPPQSSSTSTLSLPATVEGLFAVSVEKGDVDKNNVAEANFGTLTVNGVEHLVQVSGDVMRAGKVPREGGKVRATLGSSTAV